MAGDILVPYDVKLDGKKYLVLDNTYHEAPVQQTIRPFATPGGSSEYRDNDQPSWAWWGQSNFEGDGVEDWKGDKGFFQAVGLDLQDTGKVANARQFTSRVSDTLNPSGYLIFTNLTITRQFVIGKDTSTAWYSDDGVTYTSVAMAAGGTPTSWGFFRGTILVGMSNGTIQTTSDNGVTWVVQSSIPVYNSNPVFLLGSYRNKLYLCFGNAVKSWDGTTLANPGSSTTDILLEGAPSCSAGGAGVMFIMTKGNPSRMYMMQGEQLSEMAQWGNDFQPEDAIFTDTLYVVGGGPDLSGGQYGERWKYTGQGLQLDYEFPTIHGTGQDYRIRSLGTRAGSLLFSYNKGFGVGEYDPTLDVYDDPILGNALGSRTNSPASGSALVIGINTWKGAATIGVASLGIYQESGYCNFQLTSSLFGSTSKRVNKMWGQGELTFSQLYPGQSITLEYSKDAGANWSLLGTASYDAADATKVKAYFDFPANYLSPYLQYRLTGYANNFPLAVLDVALSFIEVSANPKRTWRFVIELYGDADEPMLYRDDTPFERTSKQMKDDLDALWNKRFSFEDIFGKTYTVMMPAPHTRLAFVTRLADDSDPSLVTGVEAQYTINLVQV